jgi:hypothetical protein
MILRLKWILIILFTSCNPGHQETIIGSLGHHTLDEKSSERNSSFDQSIPQIYQEEVPVTEVDLESYIVNLIGYAGIITKSNVDSIFLEASPYVMNFENKLIQIIPVDSSDTFEVFLAHGQTLTVSLGEENRFKHLNLWDKIGKYNSIPDSATYFFRTPLHYRNEKEKELRKEFNEIKAEVLKLKGEYITKNLDTVTVLNHLPVELWINREIIKIVRTGENGIKETKYIIVRNHYGC